MCAMPATTASTTSSTTMRHLSTLWGWRILHQEETTVKTVNTYDGRALARVCAHPTGETPDIVPGDLDEAAITARFARIRRAREQQQDRLRQCWRCYGRMTGPLAGVVAQRLLEDYRRDALCTACLDELAVIAGAPLPRHPRPQRPRRR
jgi:hypothetical protein